MTKMQKMFVGCFLALAALIVFDMDFNSYNVVEAKVVASTNTTKWEIANRYYDQSEKKGESFNEFYDRVLTDNPGTLIAGKTVVVKLYKVAK